MSRTGLVIHAGFATAVSSAGLARLAGAAKPAISKAFVSRTSPLRLTGFAIPATSMVLVILAAFAAP